MEYKLKIYLNKKPHILDVDSKENVIDGITFFASPEGEGATIKVNEKELHLKNKESIILNEPTEIFLELVDEETYEKEALDFIKNTKINDPLDDVYEFKALKDIKNKK